MDLGTVVEIVTAVTLLGGLLFAAVQVRQFRASRERDAAFELLRSFQTPEFARALRAVYALPEGLSKDEIERRLGEEMHLVYALMTTWESLGVLVHRGELELEMVDDFFSGPILVSWRKLRPHVEAERAEQERETIQEWFQWLAERMAERESSAPPVPAHVAHRSWTPRKRLR
ncbi:MAG: hypothetical protein ACE5HP_11700 [Gemmatimonadota bacterium]